MASTHSGVSSFRDPRFAAASPEYQSIFASMAIGRKDAPHNTVESVGSETVEESEAQLNAEEATTPTEHMEVTLAPIVNDTETLGIHDSLFAAASPEYHSVIAKPENDSVELGKREEPVSESTAGVETQPEAQCASLSPSLKECGDLGSPKFAAASREYQSIFASMAIRRKVTPVASKKMEGPVAESEPEAAILSEVKESSLTALPDATKGTNKEEPVAIPKVKGSTEVESEGEIVPRLPNDSVESERMEQPIAQSDTKISTKAKNVQESLRPISADAGALERPRFAAASPEYWDIFASMAIGKKVDTVEPERTEESTLIKEPSITLSEQTEEVVVDNDVEERTQPEIESDDLPPATADVELFEEPSFAAASPECSNIFASMAIGAKTCLRKAITASEIIESRGVLESRRPGLSTMEDAFPTTIPQIDSQVQSSGLATEDQVRHNSPINMTIEVEQASDNLAMTSDPPITDTSTTITLMTSSSHASQIPSCISTPQSIKFAVASPEFQALFASMAIPAKSDKTGPPIREIASEPHTPQRTASPTPHQVHKFPSPPSTPEKKISLSAGSSPRRRPATTDLVARRLIGAALGIRMTTKKDEKTTTIKKALGMKDKGEGKAMWKDYVASVKK